MNFIKNNQEYRIIGEGSVYYYLNDIINIIRFEKDVNCTSRKDLIKIYEGMQIYYYDKHGKFNIGFIYSIILNEEDYRKGINYPCIACRKEDNEYIIDYIKLYNHKEDNETLTYIYFIQIMNDNEYIKIGRTSNIKHRMSALKTGNPYNIKILALYLENSELEKELHNRFEKYRIRGEWFEPADEIYEYIKLNKDYDCYNLVNK